MERTILVVEDSRTQADRLRLLLESAGYRVQVAANGRQGLEAVGSSTPDLIISDVVMPEMDGYAFCRAVKADERTRRIPFVLLTERRGPADVIRGLERGADNFITKPFEDDYLLERVRRIFEHLQYREQGHLDLEVTVQVGQRRITLSADKQQIIELLFSTFEELCQLNDQLQEAQRRIEAHARELEERVRERTASLREAEQQARAARDFLESITDNSADAIVTADVRGRLTYWSPGAEDLLGYRRDETLGRPIAELYRGGLAEARAVMARLRAEGRIRHHETALRARDGRWVEVQSSVSLLRDPAGAVTGTVAVIRDVTERRRAEEALRRTEKLAAMGSLLAGVAHELNNPLSVVLGQSSLLLEQVGPGPADRVRGIVRAAERCARIVRSFLALARQQPAERSAAALGEIVGEAMELLGYQLRVDRIEVQTRPAPDLPALWADPHQLHQLVVNLVTNAHHALRQVAGPRRLTLTTRFDPAGQLAVLEVADNGPGIPPGVQARLFEPFFTTKPPGLGTGLGLSLCRAIVEEHGGQIRVESEPGRGTAFVVELPIRPGPAARPGTPAAPVTAGRARILVVDDEAELGSLLADMLALDGHQAEAVTSGQAALDRLAAARYDLLISDLRMPDMDGPQLYRRLEAGGHPLRGRFVFITGDVLNEETREFLGRTGAPCIVKPFNRAEVSRVVTTALDRATG